MGEAGRGKIKAMSLDCTSLLKNNDLIIQKNLTRAISNKVPDGSILSNLLYFRSVNIFKIRNYGYRWPFFKNKHRPYCTRHVYRAFQGWKRVGKVSAGC
jgi:hypothetical protein